MKLFHNNFWNIFRRHRASTVKQYPNTYTVMVSLQHPRLVNSIVRVPVRIDAHSKDHAREQLRKELKVTVGKTFKS
jgi:hypothetical protein